MAASKVEGERPLIKFNREIHTVIGAAVVFSYPTVFRVLTKNKTQNTTKLAIQICKISSIDGVWSLRK